MVERDLYYPTSTFGDGAASFEIDVQYTYNQKNIA